MNPRDKLSPELLERIRRVEVRMMAADVLLNCATTRDDFVDAFTEASLVTAEVVGIIGQLPADVTDDDIRIIFGEDSPMQEPEQGAKS